MWNIQSYKSKEEKGLALLDGTVKIFLNADSSRRDTNKELRAFLDYVAGKPSEDSFVKELEAALQEEIGRAHV